MAKNHIRYSTRVNIWNTLFNIIVNDLLLAATELEVCDYANGTTICTLGKGVESVILILEEDLSSALNWFRYNHMAANPEKFQIMFVKVKVKPKFILEINQKSFPIRAKLNCQESLFILS